MQSTDRYTVLDKTANFMLVRFARSPGLHDLQEFYDHGWQLHADPMNTSGSWTVLFHQP